MEQMLKQVVKQSEELYGVFRQLESESATRGEKMFLEIFLFGDCLPAFPIAGKAGDETAMLPGAQALTVRLARWALT